MMANTHLKCLSVLVGICIASAGLPRVARASENAVDTEQTAYIVVGAMVSIWIVGSLINALFDHDRDTTQTEEQVSTKSMSYDFADDLSFGLSLEPSQSMDDGTLSSESLSDIQPTLTLSAAW